MNKKNQTRIAFYDYNEKKVRYITDIDFCLPGAKISTKLEVCVDFGDSYIAIDKIVDKSLYNIGSKEMAEVMILIDEFVEGMYGESEE